MPVVAMQVKKTVPFQGREEEFSNVYTLDSGPDVSDDWSGIAQKIADLEASITSSDVRYRGYSVWTLDGSVLDRVIIDAGGLVGSGDVPVGSTYKECAALVRFEISRSPVLRRRRWLSKWLHCAFDGGSNEVISGSAPFSAATQAIAQANYIEPLLGNLGIVPEISGVFFCNSDGERPTAGELRPYREHRQFHR